MAIYDTMQYIRPDVSTVCIGMGMSAAAMILAGGAPGKRMALPNSKVMIHQGSAGFRGTPADIEIHAQEVLAMTRRMAEILATHTGQPFEKVMSDIDRDRFMTPSEALEYGLVDEIVTPQDEGPSEVLGDCVDQPVGRRRRARRRRRVAHLPLRQEPALAQARDDRVLDLLPVDALRQPQRDHVELLSSRSG